MDKIKSYIKNDRYMYQFNEFITDSYSVIKYKSNLSEGPEGIKNALVKMWDDFYYNFKSNYIDPYIINTSDILDKIKAVKLNTKYTDDSDVIDIDPNKLDIDNKFKKDVSYSINLKELKKIYNIIKYDKINIKCKYINYSGYMVILELIKNDDIIGYLLPLKKY